ncbi:MAG: hypothetical protein RR272_00535 [Synergistaceae bacterium]
MCNKLNFAKETVHSILEGTFGDREVHLCRCEPQNFNGTNVILLHGVHSSANLSHINKFKYLAESLVKRGFRAWLIETSRNTRNRDNYLDNVGAWIKAAFLGKTFAQEEEDVFIAIRKIASIVKDETKWLWGFSLGGIIALSVAAGNAEKENCEKITIDTLVLSGTGTKSYEEKNPYIMKLPILSSLCDSTNIEILKKVTTNKLISFRGENDEIFPKDNCKELLEMVNIPENNKIFIEISKADHSLRNRDGKNSPEIMEEMVDFVVDFSTT